MAKKITTEEKFTHKPKPHKDRCDYLAINLKIQRIKREWAQSDVANLLHINQPMICSYELGRCEPSLKNLKLLANIFDTTVDALMEPPTDEDMKMLEELNSEKILSPSREAK